MDEAEADKAELQAKYVRGIGIDRLRKERQQRDGVKRERCSQGSRGRGG